MSREDETAFTNLSKWFSERKNDPKTNGKLLANEVFCVLLPRLPRHLSRNRSEVNVAIFYSDEMPCWLFVAIGPIGPVGAGVLLYLSVIIATLGT